MYVVAGPNGAGKSTLTSRARHTLGLEPIDAALLIDNSSVTTPFREILETIDGELFAVSLKNAPGWVFRVLDRVGW